MVGVIIDSSEDIYRLYILVYKTNKYDIPAPINIPTLPDGGVTNTL